MELYRLKDLDIQVLMNLDSRFAKDLEMPIEAFCDEVEALLLRILSGFVIEEISLIFREKNQHILVISSESFIYNKAIYNLTFSQHGLKKNILQLSIQHINTKMTNISRKSLKIRIDSMGRYNEVRIFSEKVFLPYLSSIAEITRVILESGYRWLTERVRIELNSMQNQYACALYSYLRRFLSEKIMESLWLYAHVERNGIYLLDDISRRVALARASERKLNVNRSPLELISEFSTKLLDTDQLFSTKALLRGEIVEADFINVQYAGSGLETAEQAIYQTDRYIIHPIIREGKTRLCAGYPIEVRDLIEPVLNREKSNIKKIVEDGASALRHSIQQLKSQGGLRLSISDYLELKPNLGGIGINLNKVITDIAKYYKSRR